MKLHRNCCGLDVHKQTIAACLIREDINGITSKEKRLFGTMTQQLRDLAQWLREAPVTAVAMEASGVYWVPVGNVLEGLQDGRLEGSYVPPPELRVLRDLPHYRIRLVEQQSSIACQDSKENSFPHTVENDTTLRAESAMFTMPSARTAPWNTVP